MKRSAGNGGHGAEQDERGNKMKARQYFEKHRQEMTCGDEKKVQAAINQLVLELNDEAKDMLKSRNVNTDRAAVSVQCGRRPVREALWGLSADARRIPESLEKQDADNSAISPAGQGLLICSIIANW